MNQLRRLVELSILGACAVVLSGALLPMVLSPGDTPTEGNPLWRAILACCYLGVTVVLVVDYRTTLLAIRRNWLLVALVLLALVSFLWSYNPRLVLQRSVAVLGATLFGLALAGRFSLEEQLRLMSWIFRIIAVLSLACVILAPRHGISDFPEQGAWRGVFNHKNGLGAIMALSVLTEWHLPANTRFAKVLNVSAILLSAVLLVFSNSITAMVALVGALVFIQCYKLARHRFRLPMFAIVSVILLTITSAAALVLFAGDTITTVLGRSSNLSGRTDIWRLVISSALEHPILGYGFAGFWGGVAPQSLTLDRRMGFHVLYSHNGYLDIFLTLGLVGLLLVSGLLASSVKRAFYCAESNESPVDFWPLALLSFVLLYNLAECTILTQDLQWSLFLASVVGADLALGVEPEEEFLLVPAEEFS
jgi:exopolysaccharide production protein ExoQ